MKLQPLIRSFVVTIVFSARLFATTETNQPSSQPTPYLSPADEAKTFVLPKGYRLELVVSDPIIREPVVAVFDGDGKMFVAEMRTYMQDIDGKNQHTTNGCVSLHWSSKHNGVYDKHTIFADHLILPRMILPLADGLLVNETDSNDLWLYRDTNLDGVADEKTLLFKGGPRGGNLEHQQSGLIWNLDNWLYMTVNDYRLRIQGNNMLQEPTPAGGGQWGISHDDYGKPWFVNAGGEIGPLHFQQPYVYGRFTVPDELTPNYREVWPLIGLADVQGGDIRFRPTDKTLNHLTAACGGEIVRGDRLPKDLRGDLLFAEPVGRLIRRSKIDVKDGVTYLRNSEERSEFIRSTDANFRPVNLVNAPDGTLYIVDMYRGIIQEGNWVREGSYLRTVVQRYELDKNFGRGRIWRLVHKDFKPGPQPRLQNEKSKKLVRDLEHPNGWWRDTAQKILVLRHDKSVVLPLTKMALNHKNHLARIHALWTLEGIDALTPPLLRAMFYDSHPQVRVAAIRASETLYKSGDHSLIPDIRALTSDPDPNVVIQVFLTAHFLKWENDEEFIQTSMEKNPARGVQEIGQQLLTPQTGDHRRFTQEQKRLMRRGENIFNELCFTCHGYDGKGMPLQGGKPGETMAPPLAGSQTVTGLSDELLCVLLKGLSGPVNGKTYTAQMVSMESNDDTWIASVASYVRNSFGNNASFIDPDDVAKLRSKFKERGAQWTLEELPEVVPHFLTNRASWKLSAKLNPDGVARAIDGDLGTRYDTGKSQAPGDWFQIEFPEETTVSGVYLNAGSSFGDFPHGYKLMVSDDGQQWAQPLVTGSGTAQTTEINFPPLSTKFIRITLTKPVHGTFWSIHELQVLQPPDLGKLKTALSKKAEASRYE